LDVKKAPAIFVPVLFYFIKDYYIATIQEPEARIKRKPDLVMVVFCQCSTLKS